MQTLGRGPGGQVIRAYDPALQREVAIRVVGADEAAGGLERVVADAKAIAAVRHPNVVEIFDVDELPPSNAAPPAVAIVMEYVQGSTLTAWLEERPRGWKRIVEVFVSAGRGLAAAHDRGIFHGSFGPSAVLLSEATVKVAGFGLHRAAASAAADQERFASTLGEALERATSPRRGGETSTLGGVPARVREALARACAPTPERQWPSLRALVDALERASSPPKTWPVTLGGSALLMMAGAGWLTGTLDRSARCSEDGARTQLDEIWGASQREAARRAFDAVEASYAREAWRRTASQLDAYAEQWSAASFRVCEGTTRGAESSEQHRAQASCLRRARTELEAAVGVLVDADAEVVRRSHGVTGFLRPLTQCVEVDPERPLAPLPADVERVDEIRRHLAAATAAYHAGRFRAELAHAETAKQLVEGVDYDPVRIEVALAEGLALDENGDPRAAELAYRDALRLSVRGDRDSMAEAAGRLMFLVGWQGGRASEGAAYRRIAGALARGDESREVTFAVRAVLALHRAGRTDEAEALGRAVLRASEGSSVVPASQIRALRTNLAIVLDGKRAYDEAAQLFREELAHDLEQLGADHPDVGSDRNNLANILRGQSDFAGAERELRSALEIRIAALGPSHPLVAETRTNLGGVLEDLGRSAEAVELHQAAFDALLDRLGPDHPNTAVVANNLGNSLGSVGRLEEAEAILRHALSIRERVLAPDHPDLGTSHSDLAGALYARGKYEEAAEESRRAMAVFSARGPGDRVSMGYAHTSLAASLLVLGRYDEAGAEFRRAADAWRRALGPDAALVRLAETNLAGVALAQGHYEEAAAGYRTGIARMSELVGPDHVMISVFEMELAETLRHLGDDEGAEEAIRRSLEIQRLQRPDGHPDITLAEAVLCEVLADRGKTVESRALAERIWEQPRDESVDQSARARAGFVLAKLSYLRGAPARERARSIAEQSLALIEPSPQLAELRADIHQWLADH